MNWKLEKETKQNICYKISPGSRMSSSLKELETLNGTSVSIVYSEKSRLYSAKTFFELHHFGEMEKIYAHLSGVDKDFPRWYLELLFATKDNQRYSLLEWRGQLGIALLLRNLQGIQPHYLELPHGIHFDFEKDEYFTFSSTDSPKTREQIKIALEDLSKTFNGENNLSEIIYSDLLKN